jgi:hypothetical protein
MTLYERIRALATQLGGEVFSDADGFRAALDDYLDEGSATTGEINLLVDAVRLDAARRMLTMIEHGAEPAAAVAQAGEQLARDRGSDDLNRSRWACAVVGFALGKVDEAEVLRHQTMPMPPDAPPDTTPQSSPPSTSPSPLQPGIPDADAETQVQTPYQPTPVPPQPQQSPPQQYQSPQQPYQPPPEPYQPPHPRQSRRRGIIIAAATGLIVVAAIAGAMIVFGDEDTNGNGDPTTISEEEMIVPIEDANGLNRLFAVNPETGEQSAPLTDGPNDKLPAISPDRTTIVFTRIQSGESPGEPWVLELDTGEEYRLFSEGDPCTYSYRPGFDLTGERLALNCQDDDGNPAGLYVVDLDGQVIDKIPTTGTAEGGVTWISEDEIVYIQQGADESTPTTLWVVDLLGNSKPLTDGSPAWDSHPDWSPETQELLFSRHPTRANFYGDLYVADREGAIIDNTTGAAFGHPVWSPDGTQIAVTQKDDEGVIRLYVTSLDGSEPVLVPGITGVPGAPVWDSR